MGRRELRVALGRVEGEGTATGAIGSRRDRMLEVGRLGGLFGKKAGAYRGAAFLKPICDTQQKMLLRRLIGTAPPERGPVWAPRFAARRRPL